MDVSVFQGALTFTTHVHRRPHFIGGGGKEINVRNMHQRGSLANHESLTVEDAG